MGTDQEICGCLWEITQENCDKLAKRAGINPGEFNLEIYRRPMPQAADRP